MMSTEPRIIGPKIGPRPIGAQGLIVAEYETDESDIQTDYFATKTRVTVPLAWSVHARESVPSQETAVIFPRPAPTLAGAKPSRRKR